MPDCGMGQDQGASARAITRGASPARATGGEIEGPGDTDWFVVELDEGETYRMDLEGWRTGRAPWTTRCCWAFTTSAAT